MPSSNPKRRIAIARLTGVPDAKGRWTATFGGDGLATIRPPFRAELYRPDYIGNDLAQILKTATRGPNEDGDYIEIEIRSVHLLPKKALIRFSPMDSERVPEPESCIGCWLCVRACQLEAATEEDEYFVYQILGLPVYKDASDASPLGRVTDFLETGAHGVIEIQYGSKQRPVMVPVLSRFVNFNQDKSALIIPDLDDFLV